MATKQRCPKCNELNDLRVPHCLHCNAPLMLSCPICRTPRPWYVQRCPRCEASPSDDSLFTDLFRRTPTTRLHGRYQLSQRLSAGRVSAVYKASDAGGAGSGGAHPSPVAIMELSTMALITPHERHQAEETFLAAVERWAGLQHPGLARIVETFRHREHHYVVFDYVDGPSFEQLILRDEFAATPDLARNWGAQLCNTISFLQEQLSPLHVSFLAPSHVMVNQFFIVRRKRAESAPRQRQFLREPAFQIDRVELTLETVE